MAVRHVRVALQTTPFVYSGESAFSCRDKSAIADVGRRERKKSHDKIYPKGYVEMLEQQQGQLVQGLQDMYHRMQATQLWQGPTLSEATGKPLTHDILSALGLLEKKHDDSEETITFEEDCEKLQARLIAEGAALTKRRGSFSSDSDHSNHAHLSAHSTPVLSKTLPFKENSGFGAPPSPPTRSPAPKQRKTHPPAIQSPLHRNAPMINNDPQLFQPGWALGDQTLQDPQAVTKANFLSKLSPMQQNALYDAGAFSEAPFMDSPMTSEFDFGDIPYPQMTFNGFAPLQDFGYGAYDPMMDVDFKSFIATA